MSTAAERIMSAYDQIILDAGEDGMKVSEARESVAETVAANPEAYEMPSTEDLVRSFVESVVTEHRNSRARRRLVLFQTCHDAVTGLTLLGKDDPILDLALRTGASDGLDKSLRHFTVEDWLDVLGASASNVADAIQADKELRTLLNPIIAAYGHRSARRLEDML